MTRILALVEGQTEENFVNQVLAPHLYAFGYTAVSARLLGNARQRSRRGGIRQWISTRSDILNHLKEDNAVLVTTMVDYYGLPDTWPGRREAGSLNSPKERAAGVERAILDDIANSLDSDSETQRFVPYVVMHEFEGLLFSDPIEFARSIGKPDLSTSLQAIRAGFSSPEEINDSSETAPSRRVLDLYAGYQKPLMGVQAANAIGLDAIRGECPLFSEWIGKLERIA